SNSGTASGSGAPLPLLVASPTLAGPVCTRSVQLARNTCLFGGDLFVLKQFIQAAGDFCIAPRAERGPKHTTDESTPRLSTLPCGAVHLADDFLGNGDGDFQARHRRLCSFVP